LIGQLKEVEIEAYWVTQSDHDKENYNIQQPGVWILTDLSSLGLEFKVVIIIWVQKYANACATELYPIAPSN